MLTVDYTFYTETFRGKLPEAEFERQAVYASAYLDELTMGRTSGVLPPDTLERAKLALCAIVDAHATNEKIGDVASESNDGVSITYRSGSDGITPGKRLYDAAACFLSNTGLLYRGVR